MKPIEKKASESASPEEAIHAILPTRAVQDVRWSRGLHLASRVLGKGMAKRGVPEGLWIRCPQCKATIFRKEMESRFRVCPECGYHFHVSARERICQLLDAESFEEWFTNLYPKDALGFRDRLPYEERLRAEQAKTGMPDAAVMGRGYIRGRPVVF